VDADYIVVGTGSAGSVMANRLSTDPSAQVVVLEAGPRDKDKFIHIPAAFAKLFRSDMDWDYFTEPQKELDGREIYWPRGKVLGGSSSIERDGLGAWLCRRLRRVGRAPASSGVTPTSRSTSTASNAGA
jgi:choline dehydrogenase-like flavoprotein